MEVLIAHEQYHREQFHSVDTLLLEILTVVYWFNPAIWLFRRSIKAEHEYMVDRQVLERGFDPLDYQHLLFRTRTGVSLQLGNHFSNGGDLKKRFKMMERERNKNSFAYLRLTLFLPVMFVILAFGSSFKTSDTNSNGQKIILRDHSKSADGRSAMENIQSDLFTNEEPLYILKNDGDDKLVKPSFLQERSLSEIESINIVKGDKAKEKYGSNAKNGVVEFRLKN
ncbi:hypothetical protein GWK08_01210 [Leptobacterium flavescens]|uniref:Peptidase M56 domain-containing protein n=2 Tax=Leptobacterium flavescens TaxID=472055 RepID=A0A6P0UNY0_9FLAO|nr:hypothetical protein [Leptobacterium flavescens]